MAIDNSKYGISKEDIERAALGDFDDYVPSVQSQPEVNKLVCELMPADQPEQPDASFVFCTSCGRQLPAAAKFCTGCGSKVEDYQNDVAMYDYAPVYDNAPAFDNAPVFDNAPSFDNAPAFDNTPAFDNAPVYGGAPQFEDISSFGSDPQFDDGPTISVDDIPMVQQNPIDNGDFIFCTSCGTKLPADMNFCTNCGTSVASDLPYADEPYMDTPVMDAPVMNTPVVNNQNDDMFVSDLRSYRTPADPFASQVSAEPSESSGGFFSKFKKKK